MVIIVGLWFSPTRFNQAGTIKYLLACQHVFFLSFGYNQINYIGLIRPKLIDRLFPSIVLIISYLVSISSNIPGRL